MLPGEWCTEEAAQAMVSQTERLIRQHREQLHRVRRELRQMQPRRTLEHVILRSGMELEEQTLSDFLGVLLRRRETQLRTLERARGMRR